MKYYRSSIHFIVSLFFNLFVQANTNSVQALQQESYKQNNQHYQHYQHYHKDLYILGKNFLYRLKGYIVDYIKALKLFRQSCQGDYAGGLMALASCIEKVRL